MKDKKFNVVIPAELSKSNDGEWRVRGLASTESRDQQGEVMSLDGMDLTKLDKKKGILNFDHKPGVENLVGFIDGYNRTKSGLFIEGRLFKNHDKAKAIYQIMSSLNKSDFGRVGLSVEGSIKERAGKDGKVIKKSVITGVAITLNPVNTDTYVDLVKSMTANEVEFDLPTDNNIHFNASEEGFPSSDSDSESNLASSKAQGPLFSSEQVLDIVMKALSVGGEKAITTPSQRSGGAALAQEDLDKKCSDVQKADVEVEIDEDGESETKVEMDMDEFKDEHKKLAQKLRDCDKDEAKTQEKELKAVESQEKKIKKGSAEWFQKGIIDAMDALKMLYPDVDTAILLTALQTRLNTKYGVKAEDNE